MAVKKSDLYSSIWESCDELRGGMDASQYKDYVLVLLFMKYVSDKYAGRDDALLEVPEGASYADMVALAGNKNIGEEINKIIARFAEANGLDGVITLADFNDEDKLGRGKDLVDRVSDLVKVFNRPSLDFRNNRAEDDDLLGDAYEYLMRHFATESEKSKGQFYTPAEVSRIMARLIGIDRAMRGDQTIYDPTCGSGSLLLKAHAGAKHGTGHDLTIYGQEMDNATTALAKMNMILHGSPTAEIWQGNTMSEPHWEDGGDLKRYDFAVANPPFSSKNWRKGIKPEEDEFDRFDAYGVPPKKNGDYAFLLHLLASLKSTGTGCIRHAARRPVPRRKRGAQIRRELLRRGYIKAVIGLPANLFYGTGIPACLVVLDKREADDRDAPVFMIDASRGFRKDGPKNRLRERDIHRVVDVYTGGDESDPRYARSVPLSEIEANDYNLNIPRYVDSSEPEDRQDVVAHMRGGIPRRGRGRPRRILGSLPRFAGRPVRAVRPGRLQPTESVGGSGAGDHPGPPTLRTICRGHGGDLRRLGGRRPAEAGRHRRGHLPQTADPRSRRVDPRRLLRQAAGGALCGFISTCSTSGRRR